MYLPQVGSKTALMDGVVQGCLGTADCGARFVVRLAEEIEEGTLSYRFKFGEEYGRADNWTEGGKLPGMADEDAATACGRSKDVSGTGSFVARTMWRLGGAASTDNCCCFLDL